MENTNTGRRCAVAVTSFAGVGVTPGWEQSMVRWSNSRFSIFVFLIFQIKGMSLLKQSQSDQRNPRTTEDAEPNPISRAFFALFGGNKRATVTAFNEEGAKKVDPKLFFANERTFLKWMNVSIYVAGISIGLSSIGGHHPGRLESLSGLFFLAIAIVTVCYSMFQCKWQIQHCEDK